MKNRIFELMHHDLAHHYKQTYFRYLTADISDDNFELGSLMELEYVLLEYHGFTKQFLHYLQNEVKIYHAGSEKTFRES